MYSGSDGAGNVYSRGKQLRCGYTTGTCAAAATKAAVTALLSGTFPSKTELITPGGKRLILEIESPLINAEKASCAVRKDGGDDIDATDGLLIFSKVSKRNDGAFVIDGGEGVGKITKRGLDQPIGAAAINSVPRSMIYASAKEICDTFDHTGGIDIEIIIPGGAGVANRTFNPRLGIEGGISVLGTSGIVEPMSNRAILETVKAELNVIYAEGKRNALLVPGNYGMSYLNELDIDKTVAVMCSNFIGEAVDYACALGFDGILIVGNLGKLVKVAGGIMDTHSRNGDCRMEIIAAAAIQSGCNAQTAREVLECVTTDDALSVLESTGLMDGTVSILIKKIDFNLRNRASARTRIGAAIFSSAYGRIGLTENAGQIVADISGGI